MAIQAKMSSKPVSGPLPLPTKWTASSPRPFTPRSSVVARLIDHEDLLDRGRVRRGGGRRPQTGRGRRRVRQVSEGPGRDQLDLCMIS